MPRKVLFSYDIAAPLLSFGTDILATSRYDGYSYAGQTTSGLSAVGTPTPSLWIPLALVYSIQMIACGVGMWMSAGLKRALHLVAGMVTGLGILS